MIRPLGTLAALALAAAGMAAKPTPQPTSKAAQVCHAIVQSVSELDVSSLAEDQALLLELWRVRDSVDPLALLPPKYAEFARQSV